MKPITTSIFTFEKLVEGGYVYVDKTGKLYDLIRPPFGVYFLSRPRRFGKSLTISTLEAILLVRDGYAQLLDQAAEIWPADHSRNLARTAGRIGLFGLRSRVVLALESGDVDRAMQTLRIFFADIPYDIPLSHEKYYQTIFFVLLRLLALDVDCEVRTEAGRIDAVVKTAARIFVFEFKLQGTAEDALQQSHQRCYHEKYAADDREVLLVGAAFDPETRNLDRWLVERL